jgi:ATP-dependent helicase/nuclease subunit B
VSGVFTIGIDRPFADELAHGLLTQHAGDPLTLVDALILLPTRRSVRALREAFLRAAGGKPTLLPRLAPLGDVEESEWTAPPDEEAALALPAAIDPAAREAMLAQLVALFADDAGEKIAQTPSQALKLARELAGLLDELAIHGVPFDKLEGLVEGNFSTHWQRTLKFLDIVGRAWPEILAERGQIDAIDRRTRAIRAQAERWRAAPPTTPVIAAGSTGSQPATRELLAVVAQLPQGSIVLPGLDRDLDEESWSKLDPTHPQFGLRELLGALKMERRQVTEWPGAPGSKGGNVVRRKLVAELMRPAETTEQWEAPNALALEHVTRADCATPQQEAVVIALALREALEKPGQTASLVTPDRELARRVAAELKRWGVAVDDSAGLPLADTPPATLLRLIAAAIDGGFAPVDMLALLKHPLCTLGLDRAVLLDAARRLDRKCLRGLKPDRGIDAIKQRVVKAEFGNDADRQCVADLMQRLDERTSALAELMAAGAPPAELIDATVAAAEEIASAEALWRGDAGEALADALARLREGWAGRPAIGPSEWPLLLTTMLATEAIRPRYGRHPRLAIWGPLEARLQHPDLLVLGGLNEGSWPRAVETGPWVNRPMRAALGLPQPERLIGLSAHDFVSALAAERVLITRSERDGGAPTVPSRWLSRLDALLGYEPGRAGPAPVYIQRGRHLLDWAEAIDRATYKPWPRPKPSPPLAARPTTLSVTDIERWRRDPYGLYAKRVLDLDPLRPLEEELGAADRGSALHEALEKFLLDHPSGLLPPDAEARFEAVGEKALRALLAAPAERAFWWPRFQRLVRWFVGTENARRANGTRLLALERWGHLQVGPTSRPLAIRGLADRIDEVEPGVWNIIDYKTGRVPSTDELKHLFAPQLLLEAAMAERGGFEGVAGKPREIHLSYWRTNGLGAGGEVKDVDDAPELIARMMAEIEKLASLFANPAMPYIALPWPKYLPLFNDYEHLERATEWSTGDGEDDIPGAGA